MHYFRLLVSFVLLLALSHGIFVLWHYHHDRWPADLYNRPILLQGDVANLPQQKNNATTFWLQTPQGLVQLNWYYPYPKIKPGESLVLTAKMQPDTFQGNAGEFDYGRYLRQQGVLASGYVMTKPPAVSLGIRPWKTPVQFLRFYVYQKILETTHDLAMQGILIALILGDKSFLNPVQWQVFTASGTSYFMVISGLHIVLFALLCGLTGRYLWSLLPRAPLLFPAQRLGLIIGLVAGLLYSLLAGFSIPTQRALWMLWLMGIAKLFLQRIPSLSLLFAAALIVIAWNPLSLYSIAFWLSFIAVFFLIYIMSARFRKLSKLEEWIYPQWVIYFALMPPLLYVFHEFSLISLISNFLALPVMMLAVIPLALLGGTLLFIIPPAGHFCFMLSNAIMHWVWVFLKWSITVPHAVLYLPQPSLYIVILSLAGCLLLFAPRGFPLRFAGILFLLPLVFPKPFVPSGTVKIIPLRLTEGEATVFVTAHSVLIEQNIKHLRAAKSAIRTIIIPYLQRQGKNSINLWVINGTKNYHALRSLENAWQNRPINRIILPRLPKTFDSLLASCQKPKYLKLDHIQFVIHPENNLCTIKVLDV